MLEVYVAPGCEICDHARALAQRVAAELEHVHVAVIDIEESPDRVPAAVFAVPSFLLNGALISLGNPSWERLTQLLSNGAGA